jgi:Lrp/AsnC family transcriptional regulator, regulator for asnA, asnC and gidA
MATSKKSGGKKLLDEIDKMIIHTLRQDCFTPFVMIARRMNVTEGTIRHRIKKMIKNGVIKKFTIATDSTLLGFDTVAFVIVGVEPGHVSEVAKDLAKLSCVLEVHEVHTYGDFLLKVHASSLNDIAQIISKQIKTINGVASSQVIPVLNVWKDEVHSQGSANT